MLFYGAILGLTSFGQVSIVQQMLLFFCSDYLGFYIEDNNKIF